MICAPLLLAVVLAVTVSPGHSLPAATVVSSTEAAAYAKFKASSSPLPWTEFKKCGPDLAGAYGNYTNEATKFNLCYTSRQDSLVGGYSCAGTNVMLDGTSEDFAFVGCVCSCHGTNDGLVCNGTNGHSAYSLMTWVPETTMVEIGTMGAMMWNGREVRMHRTI
jgi:hypothetical protein